MSAEQDTQHHDLSRRRFINNLGRVAAGSVPVIATLQSRSVLAATEQMWSPSAAASCNPSHELYIDANEQLGQSTQDLRKLNVAANAWPTSIFSGITDLNALPVEAHEGYSSPLTVGQQKGALKHLLATSNNETYNNAYQPDGYVVQRSKNKSVRWTADPLDNAVRLEELTPDGAYYPCAGQPLSACPVLQLLWMDVNKVNHSYDNIRRARIAALIQLNAAMNGKKKGPKNFPLSPMQAASFVENMYTNDLWQPGDLGIYDLNGMTSITDFLESLLIKPVMNT